MGKKSKNEKKLNKKKINREWSQIERHALTKEVLPKLLELGLGIYYDEIDLLTEIIKKYVEEATECEQIIKLPNSGRYLEIKLMKTKKISPLICLRMDNNN